MKKDLIKNTFIFGIGKFSTQFLAILLIPLYTIFLAPDEFGLGDLIVTYAALLSPLATLGIEQGMFRMLVDARSDESKKTLVLSTSLRIIAPIFIGLIVTALLVGWLASLPLLLAGSTYIATATAVKVCQWVARGFGDNLAFSIGSIVTGVVATALSVIFIALFDMGADGMLYALALGNIAGLIYFIRKLKAWSYVNLKLYDKKLAKQLVGYSLPLIPNDMSWWAMNAADRTIIAIVVGVAATGVYAIAVKFPAILAGLFTVFWAAWYEVASLNIAAKNKDDMFSKTVNTIILFFGSLTLLIVSAVPLVFPYIVGEEFHESYNYIPLLMIAAFFGVIAKAYGAIYAAKKQTAKVLTTTLVSAAVGVAITVSLIGYLGLYAAAIGGIVANLVMAVMRHRDINFHTKIVINYRAVAPLIVAAAGSTYVYYMDVFALSAVSVVVALLFMIIMNMNVFNTIKDMVWKSR